MPRYFFDVEDADTTVDERGMDIESLETVEAVALRTLLDIARFELLRSNERGLSVTVRDEAGVEIFRTELAVTSAWLT